MNFSGRKICIAGAGGFGRETLCCLVDSLAGSGKKIEDVACFMEKDEVYKQTHIHGIEVIRQSQFDPEKYEVVVAIGPPAIRKKVVESLPQETRFATIIHPSAVISQWVSIGEGSIVTAGSILTCDIRIGRHAHFNLHTTIGHDVVAGDYFTTAPAVNISGNCRFGDCVYFGTNAGIREGITVCSNVTIGLGGVVVKDITEPGTYVGSPVKKLEKK
jgi:sugar O-acyltransferase (sialic acid O-acetyltransferase NeuD family)